MRKFIIIILFTLTFFLAFNFNSLVYALDVSRENSFRMRIIANSDSVKDQLIKTKIKNNIEEWLFPKIKKIDSKEDMELLLKTNKSRIRTIVSKVLKENKSKYKYKILIGNNYFPKKEKYNQNFPAGKYTSVVIKLGKAKGKNWWCILFPPLCLMDGNKNNDDKVEYKFFIAEKIKKWFN